MGPNPDCEWCFDLGRECPECRQDRVEYYGDRLYNQEQDDQASQKDESQWAKTKH